MQPASHSSLNGYIPLGHLEVMASAPAVKEGRLWRITEHGDRLYVPAMAKFNLVRKHHDEIGHPGFERTFELLGREFWFPKVRRFVRKYTAACMQCAFAKGGYGKGCLHPIEKRAVPFDTVHVDHLGPFVKSARRHSYILMVIDAFTKFTIAKPTRTLSSVEVIEQLRWIFGEFGYPRRIISDQGLAFTSRAFAGFLAEKGVRHVKNAIATPRANGQVERPNRTIIEALTTSAGSGARWDEQQEQGFTLGGYSPADLLFSYHNGLVPDLTAESSGTAQAGEEKLLAARRNAKENLAESSRRMKARYDKRRKVATEYKVLPNDRYEIISLQGVKGYKRFKAVVAVDALRRYQSGACAGGVVSGDDSSDGDIAESGRQDLIDLLES
ncbi:hypothetical protein NQ317_000799 [Molorchus minor]|uniref:RNA-directed DNA polymerase n=1 Tax=Molorchus minor TaxID=1323400 RepID=A0ABQ9IWZ9_9CUCU|nr:hypothetical protein NQ317_000799 [Molorchus minor]